MKFAHILHTIILLTCLNIPLQAQHLFSSKAPSGQTLYYLLLNEKEIAVTFADEGLGHPYLGYEKPEGNLVIPTQVTWHGKSYTVRSIGERAFKACVKLTSVTIPSTVTAIGDRAFYFCDALKTVVIPSSVTSIGEKAFDVCFSLDAESKKALGIEEQQHLQRTSVQYNFAATATVSNDGKSVTINGGNGKYAELYSNQGHLVLNVLCQSDSTQINLPGPGSYMLRVGAESFRIVVK